ncbi:MAG: universal stress protein UspA [Clostridiales bacterium]|nr:universal stress protein UspA [Clostridiales bacterium]MBQ4637398.1 universal stress protein [Clostridia bacterium]
MSDHILVCVTGQRTCDRLIRHSAQFSQTLECPVSVIHVSSTRNNFLGIRNESEALEYLYQKSREIEADMTVIRADDVIGTIADFARKKHITHIILGGPVATSTWDVPKLLKEKLPQVEFYVIPSDVTVPIKTALITNM